MWTRESIKSKAKEALQGNYWKAFWVSLVLVIVTVNGSSSRRNNSSINNGIDNFTGSRSSFISDATRLYLKLSMIIASILIILIILKILIGFILEIGGRKFFIKLSEGEVNMGYLGHYFNRESYLDIVLTMLLRDVYLILWTLLLIIPGIIKTYAYSMVPYILADNPSIGYNRAIELSNSMTDGEKWDIFVLELSFLGWFLLGVLALFIGQLFVYPYYYTTKAELYLTLRQEAIANGLTSYEELNLPNLDE